jgi:uncharacterized membrane protein YhaH (DUF805 family)
MTSEYVAALLAVLIVVVAWLAVEVRRVYDAVAPLATSRIARALAEA